MKIIGILWLSFPLFANVSSGEIPSMTLRSQNMAVAKSTLNSFQGKRKTEKINTKTDRLQNMAMAESKWNTLLQNGEEKTLNTENAPLQNMAMAKSERKSLPRKRESRRINTKTAPLQNMAMAESKWNTLLQNGEEKTLNTENAPLQNMAMAKSERKSLPRKRESRRINTKTAPLQNMAMAESKWNTLLQNGEEKTLNTENAPLQNMAMTKSERKYLPRKRESRRINTKIFPSQNMAMAKSEKKSLPRKRESRRINTKTAPLQNMAMAESKWNTLLQNGEEKTLNTENAPLQNMAMAKFERKSLPRKPKTGIVNAKTVQLQNMTKTRLNWKSLLETPIIKTINIKTVEDGVNMYDLDQRERTNHTQLCPLIPKNLLGLLGIDTSIKSWRELHILHQDILLGGRNHPHNCTARHRVAIIIPCRNREDNLKTFLHHMHPILQRQGLDYGIYVIQQADNQTYNKAMSLNVGFIEATKERLWDCVIFHDIDLLPENDDILYNCPQSPRHLSSAPRSHGYKLVYEFLVGGVMAFKLEDFIKINGYSNQFWGWGGEDDDMWNRLVYHNMTLQRYIQGRGRFFNLDHEESEKSDERLETLKKGRELRDKDGLNNIKYKILDKMQHPLYTEIKVTFNHIEIMPWPMRVI